MCHVFATLAFLGYLMLYIFVGVGLKRVLSTTDAIKRAQRAYTTADNACRAGLRLLSAWTSVDLFVVLWGMLLSGVAITLLTTDMSEFDWRVVPHYYIEFAIAIRRWLDS
jgi:hypothetical protein